MKRFIFLTIALTGFSFCFINTVSAQGVGINSSGNAAAPSAILDASSTTQGQLMPRMTTAQRDAIVSPVNGLMIWNTTTNCLDVYVVNSWQGLTCGCTGPPAPPISISGNANVCGNTAGNVYSVAAVFSAMSYTWNVPAGSTINSGQGTTSITVTFGSSSGDITVTTNNSCGLSSPASLAIIVTAIPSPPTANAANPASYSLTANWNASAGTGNYYLDVSTDNGFSSFVSGYNNLNVGNVLTYNVTGLSVGATYYYRLRAGNGCGTSTNSNVISATTIAPQSCLAIKTENPFAADGVYTIDPDGSGANSPFNVYCDMTTDGGGWTYVDRGSSLSQSAFGTVQTDINVATNWHLDQNVVRQLYSNNQTYQIYIWSNTYDGERIRIFRPLVDYSLTMQLNEVWDGTSFVSGAGYSMSYFNNGPYCVLRSNKFDAMGAYSNMHWGYNGETTNYCRCVQDGNGPTNGLLFVR